MSTATANEPFIFRPSGGSGAVGHPASQDGGTGNAANDPIVHQTHREIAAIVREIAVAASQPHALDAFVSLLCDRTVRAMAAEGIVVWKVLPAHEPIRLEPLGRLGRITDQSIPHRGLPCHRLLLQESFSAGPIVVPATPHAVDPNVPSNPTEVPVALVPIHDSADHSLPTHVIEVFLEPGGGVATQRGYLRFVAQVADLAGEYFRAERLRSLIEQQELSQQIDEVIERIHCCVSSHEIQTLIVDWIADYLVADRVAMCEQGISSKVVAVSYVDQIDPLSPAVQSIAAELEKAGRDGQDGWGIDPAVATQQPDGEFELVAIVGIRESVESETNYRVGIYRRRGGEPGTDTTTQLDPAQQHQLDRLVSHGTIAINRINGSFVRSPLGWINGRSKRVRSAWLRRFVVAIGLLMVGAAVSMIPVPRVVTAPATLRPESAQRVSAFVDAVVDEIHVNHGQQVVKGQLLLTMVDSNLDAEITTLAGRHSVLTQRRSQLTETLVETGSGQFDRFEKVESERGIVEEELASVEQQIRLLTGLRETLAVRADRDGTVSGWRLKQRLLGQPVTRGQPLLEVIATDSPWMVDARVAQRRIDLLRSVDSAGQCRIDVTLDDQPDHHYPAELAQFGPAVGQAATANGQPNAESSSLVLLQMLVSSDHPPQHGTFQNQTPATVAFHCGSYCLAEALLGDFWRVVTTKAKLYLGSHAVSPEQGS